MTKSPASFNSLVIDGTRFVIRHSSFVIAPA
jgi:hypothetical protein